MTGAGRTVRLPAAEHAKLAESDPGPCDAYLIARVVEFDLMTDEESRALSHADRSDYFAESMVLNLRRNTSDEPRRDSLDRLVEAARARKAAGQDNEDPMSDTTLILRAASFAAHKHRDQRRKDAAASPYINHPLALASVLTVEGGIPPSAPVRSSRTGRPCRARRPAARRRRWRWTGLRPGARRG